MWTPGDFRLAFFTKIALGLVLLITLVHFYTQKEVQFHRVTETTLQIENEDDLYPDEFELMKQKDWEMREMIKRKYMYV